MKIRPLLPAMIAFGIASIPKASHATPKYNPFTYSYATLGEGEIELEQYADFVPLRAQDSFSGAKSWFGATQFQTEFEYGITDRLELGLYVSYAPQPPNGVIAGRLPEGNGSKQRLRLRLADEGSWPVDVALYGEVVENDREVELEAKIILQKRIDQLRVLVNLWGEREFYYVGQRDWVINPTIGLSYQVTPSVYPGIEGWMRVEWSDPAISPRPFDQGPLAYVGPTFSVNFGRFWWTVGGYVRVTETKHTLVEGDSFGNFWLRNIIGVDL